MIYMEKASPKMSDNITLVVTDECNLRCRYCYEANKQPNDMTPEMGKKCVDWLFDHYENKYDSVVFDFIGGEALVKIELLHYLTEYICQRMAGPKKWRNFCINITSNGTCFGDPRVREYIKKYKGLVYISLSLDGVKEIHDYNRSNSFDTIMRDFKYWQDEFYEGTKSTLNHEAIPYIYESIRFLIRQNVKFISMNTIYEDVWEKEDPELYYDQLIKVADFVLANQIYKTTHISLFTPWILRKAIRQNNWCGCGSCMLAIDYKGDIYPCLRFKTLSKKKPLVIGNIQDGIDYKMLLPFYFCHNTRRTPDCENCDAAAQCSNCAAFCYDETGSIFDRVSYMCEMHKARKRANEYYWAKMAELEGLTMDQLQRNQRN